jgi:hypothetical protein
MINDTLSSTIGFTPYARNIYFFFVFHFYFFFFV